MVIDDFNRIYPKWLQHEPYDCRVRDVNLTIGIAESRITKRWNLISQDGILYCRLFDYYEEVDDAFLMYMLVMIDRDNYGYDKIDFSLDDLRNRLLANQEINASKRGCRLECVGDGLYQRKNKSGGDAPSA